MVLHLLAPMRFLTALDAIGAEVSGERRRRYIFSRICMTVSSGRFLYSTWIIQKCRKWKKAASKRIRGGKGKSVKLISAEEMYSTLSGQGSRPLHSSDPCRQSIHLVELLSDMRQSSQGAIIITSRATAFNGKRDESSKVIE